MLGFAFICAIWGLYEFWKVEKMSINELYEKGEYVKVLEALEKLPPRDFKELFISLVNTYEDVFEVLNMNLSEEQWKKLLWLDSSEREREYLLSIPEEEMTEQDWNDLRACDF